MPSKRKFYKTTLSLVVLSEEPIPDPISMEDLHYECVHGDYSGGPLSHVEEVIDGPTMAKLLPEQGSDPEFFQLTEDGEDTDE